MLRSWLSKRPNTLLVDLSPSLRRHFAQKAKNLVEPNIKEGTKYRTKIQIRGYDPVVYPFINRLSLSILSTRPLPQKLLILPISIFPTDDKTMPKAAKGGYYAVKTGINPGVYRTWDECEKQVKQFRGAQYKKFPTESLALAYIRDGHAAPSEPYTKPPPGPSSQPGGETKRPSTKALADRKDPSALSTAESLAVQEGYMVSSEGFLVVYCDGSSLGNGQAGAKAGLGVYWGSKGEAERRNLAEALPGTLQTNNRGELLAIVRAIEEHPHPDLPLEIRTDSQYSISCMTQYLPKWLRNDFITANGDPVKNRDLLIHLLVLMNRMGTTRIRLKHVKGHAGHEGNEMADRLANMGAAMPSVKDRTRWLTLEDANEAAKDAWMEKQAENKPSQDGRANVQPTAVGDLSIEVEVDPDWMMTEEEMRKLDETQDF